MNREKPLICLIGESGTGKTTLANESGLSQVVSYTDRAMRPGEVDGFDYHFRSTLQLENRRVAGMFPPTLYHEVFGDIKAVTLHELRTKDIMVVTWDGAIAIRDLGIPVVIVQLDGKPYTEREGRDHDETIPKGVADWRINCRWAPYIKLEALKMALG